MILLPNLHWIEGQRSNIYLWKDEIGLFLVDSGMPADFEAILFYIQEIGCQVEDLQAIFVTHADADHAGSAAALQARSGATVYAGRETAELLTVGKAPKHMPRLVQFVIDRFMGYTPVPAEAIQKVSSEETLFIDGAWRALATPGHTTDHFALYNGTRGVLFAGDALNTRGDRLQKSPDRISVDVDAARQSAMKLVQLHPGMIACGHGRPLQDHDANDLMSFYKSLQRETAG